MDVTLSQAIVILLLVMDPVGNVPLFVSLLAPVDPRRRARVIVRECAIAFGVLLAFLFAGKQLLVLLDLPESSLDIAGGVILFLIALRMIFRTGDGVFGDTLAPRAASSWRARRCAWCGDRLSGNPMDKARYVIAVMMAVTLLPSVAGWYVIHPFARFWRRLGTVASFSIIYSLLLSGCVLLWEFRAALVGSDLGFRPWLMLLAVPAAVLGVRIARARRRHLTQRILVGVPEISSSDKGRLITDGIYGRVRNPRYLEFVLLSFVYVAFANYSGVWLLYALTFPAIHLVVLLEEPELRERFGAEYEEYCRRVPRYIPRRTPPPPPDRRG